MGCLVLIQLLLVQINTQQAAGMGGMGMNPMMMGGMNMKNQLQFALMPLPKANQKTLLECHIDNRPPMGMMNPMMQQMMMGGGMMGGGAADSSADSKDAKK